MLIGGAFCPIYRMESGTFLTDRKCEFTRMHAKVVKRPPPIMRTDMPAKAHDAKAVAKAYAAKAYAAKAA